MSITIVTMHGASQQYGACVIECPTYLEPSGVQSMQATVAEALANTSVRLLIFKGNVHAGIFCHGMSLSFVADSYANHVPLDADIDIFRSLLLAIYNADKPTVAIVQGSTIGGGVGLVAVCDFVVADAAASFSLSEGLYGLLPGIIMPFLLERIRPQKLKFMLFTAQAVQGEQAVLWGLVDFLSSDEGALQSILYKLLKALSRIQQNTVIEAKNLLCEVAHKNVQEASQLGADHLLAKLNDPLCMNDLTNYIHYGILPSKKS